MSYTTFPGALVGPSSYKPTLKFKNKESKMGDRYTQSTPDGLNSKYKEWELGWDSLRTTEKTTLIDFLYARGGFETFLWANPEDAVTYKVKCKEINYSWKSADVWEASAKFEQQVI